MKAKIALKITIAPADQPHQRNHVFPHQPREGNHVPWNLHPFQSMLYIEMGVCGIASEQPAAFGHLSLCGAIGWLMAVCITVWNLWKWVRCSRRFSLKDNVNASGKLFECEMACIFLRGPYILLSFWNCCKQKKTKRYIFLSQLTNPLLFY